MYRNLSISAAVAVVFNLACCLVLAIVVCARCGHEAAPAAKFCGHCGSALAGGGGAAVDPAETEPVIAPDSEPISADKWVVDDGVVMADVSRATALLRAGESRLAQFYGRNALGLNALSDDRDGERGRRILALLAQCRKGVRLGQSDCETCGGTGKEVRTVELTGLDGDVSTRRLGERTCALCAGKGQRVVRLNMMEMRYERGQALSSYARARQAQAYIPVGSAWVPAAVGRSLTPPLEATLKRATAAPCGDCAGYGRLDCEACDGASRLPCTNRDCEGGYVLLKKRAELSNSVRSLRRKCETCAGVGTVTCASCSGRATAACENCGGSGMRGDCAKCATEGVIECSKCEGSGQRGHLPCTTCGGGGVRLCTSCSGDGRARR